MKTNLKPPQSDTQEILLTLIEKGHVSLFDYPFLSGFRTRISDLRIKHNLPLKTVKAQRNNKRGNVYSYAIHRLTDVESAKKLYQNLTANN